MVITEKGVMDVREMQLYLSIGRKKAYELVNSKGFPAFRIGKKILVSKEGLDKWMKEQEERNDN